MPQHAQHWLLKACPDMSPVWPDKHQRTCPVLRLWMKLFMASLCLHHMRVINGVSCSYKHCPPHGARHAIADTAAYFPLCADGALNLRRCRDALNTHTPRQLRLMFALHSWHKPMVFDGNALKGALDTESTLRNFFRNTHALLRMRKHEGVASVVRWHVRSPLLC